MKQCLLRLTLSVGVSLSLAQFAGVLLAQPDPIKYGKIEMADLQLKTYAKDTSADAIVLADYGRSWFDVNASGMQLKFERHTRIKILRKSGYEWATHKIPYISYSNDNEEKVTSLKGATYNLEGGKIVPTKLTKESIFTEEVTDKVMQQRFTLPNVKEGSVIEYNYTITADLNFAWRFRGWEFQTAIPTVWSEYRATIPEYFYYQMNFQGYEPFHLYDKKPDNWNFISGGTTHNASATSHRWVTKEVPAMREEPYMTTIDNYVTKVEFELAKIQIPGQITENYSNGWGTLTKSLLDEEDFGGQLNRTGFLKDALAAVKTQSASPAERVNLVYNHIRRHMTWNESRGIYCRQNLKKAYDTRTGSAVEINLMLVAMLREAGIKADPVLISTRDHGMVLQSSAMLQKFNYVIAHAQLGEQEMLLDATDAYLKPGMLPTRCLNGNGRLISKEDSRWLAVNCSEKMTRLVNLKLALDAEGQLKGTVDESEGGYSALATRKTILLDGPEKYTETFRKNNPHWQVAKVDVSNADKVDESLGIKCEIMVSEGIQVAGDRIYFKPLVTEAEDENPFKLENRKFPVDFATPIEETFVASYTLPPGYSVEEMPKGTIVDLPEKAGRFSFMTAVNGNIIQVSSKISIRKPVFFAEEYPYLKEFYNQIVSKHAEQIVLKKSN